MSDRRQIGSVPLASWNYATPPRREGGREVALLLHRPEAGSKHWSLDSDPGERWGPGLEPWPVPVPVPVPGRRGHGNKENNFCESSYHWPGPIGVGRCLRQQQQQQEQPPAIGVPRWRPIGGPTSCSASCCEPGRLLSGPQQCFCLLGPPHGSCSRALKSVIIQNIESTHRENLACLLEIAAYQRRQLQQTGGSRARHLGGGEPPPHAKRLRATWPSPSPSLQPHQLAPAAAAAHQQQQLQHSPPHEHHHHQQQQQQQPPQQQEEEQQSRGLLELPQDCQLAILLRLEGPGELAAVSLTCRQLLALSSEACTSLQLCRPPSVPAARQLFARFVYVTALDLPWNGRSARLSDTLLAELAASQLPLRSLGLENQSAITDGGARAVVVGFSRTLRGLNLSGCTSLSQRSIAAIACHCGGLLTLQVAYCPGISSASLEILSSSCRELSSLKYSEAAGRLSGRWPQIRALTVTCDDECSSPRLHPAPEVETEAGIDAEAEAEAEPAECPLLTSLTLQFCNSFGPSTTTVSIAPPAAAAGIVAAAAAGIADAYVTAAAAAAAAADADSSSSSSGSGNGGGNKLRRLRESYPAVTRLVLDSCSGISAGSFGPLWPGLRVLHLPVSNVTDEALQGVAACCRQLEELSLHGNAHVTDHGLATVTLACRRLEVLDVSSCRHITHAEVAAVAVGRSQLLKLVVLPRQRFGVRRMRVLSRHGWSLQRDPGRYHLRRSGVCGCQACVRARAALE